MDPTFTLKTQKTFRVLATKTCTGTRETVSSVCFRSTILPPHDLLCTTCRQGNKDHSGLRSYRKLHFSWIRETTSNRNLQQIKIILTSFGWWQRCRSDRKDRWKNHSYLLRNQKTHRNYCVRYRGHQVRYHLRYSLAGTPRSNNQLESKNCANCT